MPIDAPPSGLDRSLCIPDLRPRRRDSALEALVTCAARSGLLRDAPRTLATLLRRERLYGSAIGKGVAVPHVRSIGVQQPRLVVASSAGGIDWGAPDALPVTLIWLVLAPAEVSDLAFHTMITSVVRAMRLQRQRQRVSDACLPDVVAATLREAMS